MLKDFGHHKISLGERLSRIFTFVLGLIVFALIINMLFQLADFLPSDQKRDLKELAQQERTLMERLEVTAVDAGFLKQQAGAREIYVPGVVVRLVNISEDEIPAMRLRMDFSRDGRSVCVGGLSVTDFKSGENWEVLIKCSDSVFTGTVLYGISEEDARAGLEYELTIEIGRTQAVFLQDSLPYKLLYNSSLFVE
jgi:hypothetical protein